MTAEDSTPVLVGVGQSVEKLAAPERASSPMDLAAIASRRALLDTGVFAGVLAEIDTIAVVRLFSDSSNRPRLQHGFGRAENPPRAVARRLGAEPASAIYGHLGGNTPQQLVNEMAERIAEGSVGCALLTGAEAIRTTQLALRNGVTLDWQEEDRGSLEDRGLGEPLTTPHEFAYGIGIPVQTYPLFENALRASRGQGIDAHQLAMGSLFEPFTRVASGNPYAWSQETLTASELVTVDAANRCISFPYTKRLSARDGVNQSAALVMMSVGKARDLGIDPDKWIFLHGCSEASEKLVTQRADLAASPALRDCVRQTLDMAGKELADINCFDLYSCFPAAVEIACAELGLAEDDPRGLTVTGGLPFFGGPGNNYSMHGIATMVLKLRTSPETFGLVTANGGWLSKHAAGIYSTLPLLGKWQPGGPVKGHAQGQHNTIPPFTESPAGAARIETYTVTYDRSGPRLGIVVGRLLDTDQRFLAHLPEDETLLQALTRCEGVGLTGLVRLQAGINQFVPNPDAAG